MPFRSQAQRAWMYANNPDMARRWEEHTPKGSNLPEHVKKDQKNPVRQHFELAQGRFQVPKIKTNDKRRS